MMRLLILGGTEEARAIAIGARQRYRGGLDIITSFAGRTFDPRAGAGKVRIGGFGGAAGLEDYLKRQSIDVVIDATHPFAAAMSAHADRACAVVKVPRLMVVRPPWPKHDGDHWIEADDIPAAATALVALKTDRGGAMRVMLTLGASSLRHFGGLEGFWFLVRMIKVPTDPVALRHCKVIEGRGPFDVAGERELLARHRIDVLVSRQSGGAATGAKIHAARALGLPVVMIKRPPLAPGPHAGTVDQALNWLDRTRVPS